MSQYINPSQKLFAHLDVLAAIKRGERPAPVNVEIDLSNRCDLKCAGCHFSYTHTRGPWAGHADKPDGAISGGDLMDYDLATSILVQLYAAGVKSVVWTGGGEATLHPDFDRIIACAARLGLEQGIYSHGGWIKGERAAFMKQHFKWIYISFDAHDAESYKAYKGVNRFDKVTENIRNLVSLPGDADIGMGFLLSKDNYREVFHMQKLGRDLGVTYVQFRPMILYQQDAPGELAEDTAWLDEAILRLGQYAHDSFIVADIERFRHYANWTGHSYSTCHWSALQTVITPNGKVWRCTNKREHPDALLGDLSVEPFATIWARSGGPCSVNTGCRISCRGDIPNRTLSAVFAETVHSNFI